MVTSLQDKPPGGTTGASAAPGGPDGRQDRSVSRRRRARALRPTRAPAGVAVALVLSVAFSLSAAEAVSTLAGTPLGWVPFERLAVRAAGWSWSDPLVLGAGGAVAATGLLLLLIAVVPGRTRLVPVETADPLLVIGVTRRGLCRSLRAVAESVEGVERAKARLSGGQIEIVVVTEVERTGTVLRQVGAAVGDRLGALGALGGGEVVVRLRRKED
ncbi:hypothetical protein HNP84_007962 [Thermocatellispora tengchongensis]|uniref:DUF6286 domain-containing protein n=1 Tax=Thermocatellispora tengchongensis TaxID=1073253 RepID=A0A840PGV2_9ACTN|nr:DUF6286 domain-containing protein [Thermocatellispora tengchongensis]MBB5138209.1 hypothetical protein [Thermocatellispora tengchongensis]